VTAPSRQAIRKSAWTGTGQKANGAQIQQAIRLRKVQEPATASGGDPDHAKTKGTGRIYNAQQDSIYGTEA